MQLFEQAWVLVVLLLLLLISYWGVNLYLKARIARTLMAEPTAYSLETGDFSKTMLVLGDSTGVGVGADTKEDTVAGRLVSYIGATYVENYAVSGAEVEDLGAQVEKAKREEYDLLLIQIGGNDIIAFHGAKETAQNLGVFLKTAPKAQKTVILSAGNVGGATIFPHFIRPFHTLLTLSYHKAFEKVAKESGVVYVNLFEPFWKDPFIRDPKTYFSGDGLHPSSVGYGHWFLKVKSVLGE